RSEGLYDRHIYLTRPIAPDGRSDVLHHRTPILVRALDVEKDESQNLGVTVGVNEACEWLLEWWFSRYDRYNPFPVEFADFGMSDAAKSWCDKRGIVTEIPKNLPEFKKDWLKKPFAIGASQFDKILWMDLDCEVRG